MEEIDMDKERMLEMFGHTYEDWFEAEKLLKKIFRLDDKQVMEVMFQAIRIGQEK